MRGHAARTSCRTTPAQYRPRTKDHRLPVRDPSPPSNGAFRLAVLCFGDAAHAKIDSIHLARIAFDLKRVRDRQRAIHAHIARAPRTRRARILEQGPIEPAQEVRTIPGIAKPRRRSARTRTRASARSACPATPTRAGTAARVNARASAHASARTRARGSAGVRAPSNAAHAACTGCARGGASGPRRWRACRTLAAAAQREHKHQERRRTAQLYRAGHA